MEANESPWLLANSLEQVLLVQTQTKTHLSRFLPLGQCKSESEKNSCLSSWFHCFAWDMGEPQAADAYVHLLAEVMVIVVGICAQWLAV